MSQEKDLTLLGRSENRLPASPDVAVLETFPNLGPIVDFEVVDLERQGQGQVGGLARIWSDLI